MNKLTKKEIGILAVGIFLALSSVVMAEPHPQCPAGPNVYCRHLTGGDGFVNMADGRLLYVFGFSDVTGLNTQDAMTVGMIAANAPAPTLAFKEGQQVYLSLTNVGMFMRPDLFDPHTVHFHGFPNASAIFDGLPESAVAIKMGSTFTYYYNIVTPGTFIYHCHVEATEHMQMGMVGQLYVTPKQDDLPNGTVLGTFVHHTGYKYAYNDGDGSTFYDVEYPIQVGSMDPDFHDAEQAIQPLTFEYMKDKYFLLNGRGYPDTVNPAALANTFNGHVSQPVNALITAKKGQKILLRFSNLSVTSYFTITAQGLPWKVVGIDANLLRGPTGLNTTYNSNSVTLGGGETADVLIDTSKVPVGTYFLYSTNLYQLSNNQEDNGGAMTEITITK